MIFYCCAHIRAEELVQAAKYDKALESFNKSLEREVSSTLRAKIILKKAKQLSVF